MDLENICRCCLSQGSHKDINATHVWRDKKEIYSVMLNECFNIILSSFERTAKICDGCIKHLRDSIRFKQQVLKSEHELQRQIKEWKYRADEKPEVKIEPKVDTDDDSDDYFLADAARDVNVPDIKEEKEPVKRKAEQRRKSKSLKKNAMKRSLGKWRTEKMRMSVDSLTTSIEPCELPEVTSPIDNVSPSKIDSLGGRLKAAWTTRANQDKIKHRHNLQTVLECSNATPFKNKTLLGFTCGYCPSTFPDPVDLRSHTAKHHASERLHFKTTFDMTEYNVKLDIGDLVCTLCKKPMDNLAELKSHIVNYHGKIIHGDIKDHILQFKLKKGDVYDCAMCPSTYETFKMLKQHMNKHYSNYTCSKCDTAFATKRSLNAHATTHQNGSFKCDHCDKVFSTKPKKHYHEKTKHMGARHISNCPYCDTPFRSYYQRNQHLVKVHNTEAQYKCNVCNKAYILKSLLMCHIKKNHLMEKNCQCTECGYRFFSKKALKAHMVKHTGERIYACSVCNKSYARKYTLREHTRIHDNDRRFKCGVCAVAFVQKCSLKSHLLSNHGVSVAASEIVST